MTDSPAGRRLVVAAEGTQPVGYRRAVVLAVSNILRYDDLRDVPARRRGRTGAAVGGGRTSAMGIWTSVSTTASFALQIDRLARRCHPFAAFSAVVTCLNLLTKNPK
jgi:hypothetical protein